MSSPVVKCNGPVSPEMNTVAWAGTARNSGRIRDSGAQLLKAAISVPAGSQNGYEAFKNLAWLDRGEAVACAAAIMPRPFASAGCAVENGTVLCKGLPLGKQTCAKEGDKWHAQRGGKMHRPGVAGHKRLRA